MGITVQSEHSEGVKLEDQVANVTKYILRSAPNLMHIEMVTWNWL